MYLPWTGGCLVVSVISYPLRWGPTPAPVPSQPSAARLWFAATRCLELRLLHRMRNHCCGLCRRHIEPRPRISRAAQRVGNLDTHHLPLLIGEPLKGGDVLGVKVTEASLQLQVF